MNFEDIKVDPLYYLSKSFLNEKNSLALALSSGNEEFTELYLSTRKRLVLSQLYFIRPDPWFTIFRKINPLMITAFDCSSCYWIPTAALSVAIVKLVNLQELGVQDTQIGLENLPRVFSKCKQIVKLSLSLKEKNLDQYQEDVGNMDKASLDLMKDGFARVTHLKIFPFMTLKVGNSMEPWLATLGMLTLCRNCVDLLINIAYQPAPITNTETDEAEFLEEDDSDDDDEDFDVDDGNNDGNEHFHVDDVNDDDDEVMDVDDDEDIDVDDDENIDVDDDEEMDADDGIDYNDEDVDVDKPNDEDHQDRIRRVYVDLLPHLSWTKTLKSLVILRSGSQSNDAFDGQENFIGDFIFSLMIDQGAPGVQNTGLISLERLWANEINVLEQMFDGLGVDFLPSPTVKSIILPRLRENFSPHWENLHEALLTNERYQHLEHLAEVIFARFEHLTDLKYIRGAVRDVVGLDEFCQFHPKLEQLHFQTVPDIEDVEIFGLGDWKLLLLKVLVYESYTPSQRIMDHLIKACSNIDQLHIGYVEPLGKAETVHFFNSFRFKNLTWLSICGRMFDGSYLPLMVQHCPNLERLYLNGAIEGDTFFLHLALCLPKAANLRDLRIEWDLQHCDLSRPLFFLDSLLKCCPQLERLVLIVNPESFMLDLNHYDGLGDFLVHFAKEKSNLVALCLVGFQINPATADRVRQRLLEEILPLRSPFWFHLGPALPLGNDTSVPRIHYDGIIHPVDAYFAPPRF